MPFRFVCLATLTLSHSLCFAQHAQQVEPPSLPKLPVIEPVSSGFEQVKPLPEIKPIVIADSCGVVERNMQAISNKLPKMVSGRIAFYMAEYDPKTFNILQSRGLGDVTSLHPIASTFKTMLTEAVLREVDTGKLSLKQKFKTTAANRNIEVYPPGTNRLAYLIKRTIEESDNTAAQILHLLYTPQRFDQYLQKRSPCTSMPLTTKAMWGLQGNLMSDIIGPDIQNGAETFATLPPAERQHMANQLNEATLKLTGPQIEKAIDKWFRGPHYTPQVDYYLQPTSTAKAYTDLVARTYGGFNLSKSRPFFRKIMAEGCCHPKKPRLKYKYWAGKAGSGWRMLTMTGYVEMPNGRLFAYSYFNDQSNTEDSGVIERQIRPVQRWIEGVLVGMQ